MRSANAWPGVAIVEGPALPGESEVASPGRVFAIEHDGIALTPNGVAPFFQPLPSFERQGVETWRGEEVVSIAGDRWRRQARDGPVTVHDDDDVIAVGPWKLALRADVGATIVLRRWKSRVLCRPLGHLGGYGALWLLATEPAWWITLDATGFRRRLRRVGVSYKALGGRVDPGVARFIAAGLAGIERDEGVTFDGVVDGETGLWRDRTKGVGVRFSELTKEGPSAALDGAVASVDDVAAFVRSVDPVGWEREQMLREECAIAVSMLKPEP